jgi:hypothetical protein
VLRINQLIRSPSSYYCAMVTGLRLDGTLSGRVILRVTSRQLT